MHQKVRYLYPFPSFISFFFFFSNIFFFVSTDVRMSYEPNTLYIFIKYFSSVSMFPNDDKCNLYLKLESMQNTNSFKIRGVANQFEVHGVGVGTKSKTFVTMSAGQSLLLNAHCLKILIRVCSKDAFFVSI